MESGHLVCILEIKLNFCFFSLQSQVHKSENFTRNMHKTMRKHHLWIYLTILPNKDVKSANFKLEVLFTCFDILEKIIFPPLKSQNKTYLPKKNQLELVHLKTSTQHAECDLNKIEKTFNRTFTGWKSMYQGFRIYFVRNPKLKATDTTS